MLGFWKRLWRKCEWSCFKMCVLPPRNQDLHIAEVGGIWSWHQGWHLAVPREGGGGPQLHRGTVRARSGKRDNCLFCSTTPLHAQFPALPRLPCHFLSARYTAFLQRITLLPFIFGVHHLIWFSVWSPKIKSNYFHLQILFLQKVKHSQRQLIKDIWNLAYYQGLRTWSPDVWPWARGCPNKLKVICWQYTFIIKQRLDVN